MLVYQKTMFDRYYCIKSFCHLKTLEKRFKKFILFYYNGAQKHEGFVGFEEVRSRAKTYVILTFISMHFTVDDANFCDNLKCLYVSTKAVHQQYLNCLINTWVFAG